jgi:hypothetical protein
VASNVAVIVKVVKAPGAKVVPTIGVVVVKMLLPSPQVSRSPISMGVTELIITGTPLVLVTVTVSLQALPGSSLSGQFPPLPLNARDEPVPLTVIVRVAAVSTPESLPEAENLAKAPAPKSVAAAPITRRLRSMLRFI